MQNGARKIAVEDRSPITLEMMLSICGKKVGLPLGTGGPEKARSIVSVVFTPTRGVIHPSFPLRGRWERTAKNDEQVPSPSLAAFYISSCKTRLHSLQCNRAAIVQRGPGKVKTILMYALHLAPRMALNSKSEASTQIGTAQN